MIWSGKRVLITGVTGFLGHEMARRLLSLNADVFALVRPGSDLDRLPDGVTGRTLTAATRTTDILAAVERAQPDLILHCAGRVLTDHQPEDIDDLLNSNILLFTALLEAMARGGRIRMVNIGTYLENGPEGQLQPNSLYAASKRAALEMLRYYEQQIPTSVITVKPSVIYGATDPRPRLLRILVQSAVFNRPLNLSPGEQKLDLVHVEDVLDAIELSCAQLFSASLTREYFAVSGTLLTLRDIVARIEELTGRPVPVNWGAVPYKSTEVMLPYVHGQWVPGWSPKISLKQGIRQMISSTPHPA